MRMSSVIALSMLAAAGAAHAQPLPVFGTTAKNVIFFVGDGMGVSTVTAARVMSVGVDGQLVMDQFPFTALSKTYTSDHITPDSAGTMTAMIAGVNTNSGVIGFTPDTERRDFNGDGDGKRPWTVLELAEEAGMLTGVISTARVTHATPAACFAHVNDRGLENEIALQALPTDPTYNERLGDGMEIIWGGGRRFFVPSGTTDEEGEGGSRTDGRDLRDEFQLAGYSYAWNQGDFDALTVSDLPSLGLFDRSHLEWEADRAGDVGGEPGLAEMTAKAVDLLEQATADSDRGYFLMVESGRIDHAHHAGNAYRALTDTNEFDLAIAAALDGVDLRDTLIIVTADHSHVFTMAGYPLVPADQLPYTPLSMPPEYQNSPFNNVLDVVFDISSGNVVTSTDANGIPYTVLGYANGPGYRGVTPRVDPRGDTFPGIDGNPVAGPNDPNYLQEATVPLGSETHSAEDVAIYAIGAGSFRVRGTVKNTFTFEQMIKALGLPDRR